MSPSKSKCCYSNNCLHSLKRAVPLRGCELLTFTQDIWPTDFQSNDTLSIKMSAILPRSDRPNRRIIFWRRGPRWWRPWLEAVGGFEVTVVVIIGGSEGRLAEIFKHRVQLIQIGFHCGHHNRRIIRLEQTWLGLIRLDKTWLGLIDIV